MTHFTLSELTHSDTALKHSIANVPTPEAEANLIALVGALLDPLRERFGKPITVTSGFRSPRLNRAVGGAKNSQHLLGEAADITAGSPDENRRLALCLADSHLVFDQLIDEHDYQWLHLSFCRRRDNRMQMLREHHGTYTAITPKQL